MRSIDMLHPTTRAIVLDRLPMRGEEHAVHAWAALDEARQEVDPLANLFYAERRIESVRRALGQVTRPRKRVALGRELIALEVDVDRLRAELSGCRVAS